MIEKENIGSDSHKNVEITASKNMKQCKVCGVWFERRKDKHLLCLEHNKAYIKEYRSKPENKKRSKEYKKKYRLNPKNRKIDKEYRKKYYSNSIIKNRQNKLQKNYKNKLHKFYIVSKLKQQGLTDSEITSDVIELKRQQIILIREQKEFQKELEQLKKEIEKNESNNSGN